jgi:chemotaxis signal transduction protein
MAAEAADAHEGSAHAPLPASLHELLASVGPDGVTASLEPQPQAAPDEAAFLAVTLRGARCLLPLERLRGVLAEQPRAVPLPMAPRWLLGVFPNQAELLALVDPAPALCDLATAGAGAARTQGRPGAGEGDGLPAAVIIVGSGERTLAWRVEQAGEIVQAGEGAKVAADAMRGATAPGEASIARAYVAFGLTGAAQDGPLPVLDVDAALDALMGELVEEDGHE